MSFPLNNKNLSSSLWQENINQSGEERCFIIKRDGDERSKEKNIRIFNFYHT